MSFEGQSQSFTGQPPTPSHTPPPHDFDDDAFRTPKALDSVFYDPQSIWDSAGSTEGPPLHRAPRPFAPTTPTGPRTSNSFETSGKSRSLDVHAAQLLTTPNFALLSPRLPSAEASAGQEKSGSMESLIQTPPPTNTGNGKRKEKQNGPARTHQRSESSNRALLPKPVEAGPSNPQTQSPITHFTPLPFGTPDIFNQTLEMPATAPVYPQKNIFWDNNNINDMELDFSTDNPFATPKPPSQSLEPFVSQADVAPLIHQGTYIDFDQVLANPDYNASLGFPQQLDTQAPSFGQGVDPSLLFSSKTPAGISFPAPDGNESLQPYAYQMQEARREMAYAGINKAKRRRKPSVDSPAVAAALETLRDNPNRPGVRRSMTESQVPRSGRSSSSSSRAGTSHGGRSSPLKQVRADAKRRHRASVGLVIGADGRARLETVLHQDQGGSSRGDGDMDVDSTAYSSGSESTESEDDVESSPNAMVTSFSSDAGSGPGLPKMGRFGPGPHSQKSSFSSMYSSNSEPTKVRKSSKSAKTTKSSSKRTSRHILDPVKEGGSFEDDRGQEADSAQAALMHSMRISQRGRYSPQKQSSGLEPFVSSPSTIPDTGFGTPTSSSSGRRTSYR